MKKSDSFFVPVLVDAATPRLRWILSCIENELPGYHFKIIANSEDFRSIDSVKINYSLQKSSAQGFKLPTCSLLFEDKIKPQNVRVEKAFDLPILFPAATENADFPFDIFAAVFYLLSRYEEYLPSEKDAHGRFQAKNSLAARHDFLHLPLVQLWLAEFVKSLRKFYPHLPAPQTKTYRFLPTYDIDIAWSFREKGFVRNAGGLALDFLKLKGKNIAARFKTLSGTQKDPFDVYDFLENLHTQHRLSPVYFFLLGRRDTFDKNIAPDNPNLIHLIQKIHQKHPVGIHPSYASNENENLLSKEIKTLQNILSEKIIHSRQHYLKLKFPVTYQSLLRYDLENDYTMGYAAQPGFRASTANSYLWFDLKKNRSTDLRIHPFQIMDVTFSQYLKSSPAETLKTVENLINITKSVGGTFCSLWHNSSFPDAAAYKLYEDIVLLAKSKQSETSSLTSKI